MFERVAVYVALLLGLYIAVWPALPRLEGKFFPVVQDTNVTEISPWVHNTGWSVIRGRTDKIRDCEFVKISFYLGDFEARSQAQIQFLETTKTRPPTPFDWGPWAVQLTPEQLIQNSHAIATHRCHDWYLTKTVFWIRPHPIPEVEHLLSEQDPIRLNKPPTVTVPPATLQ